MKEEARKYGWGKRLLAFALAMLMMVGYLPTAADAASEPGTVDTVADPGTLPRVEQIYGKNTQNAGKVTVGKSVATDEETVSVGGYDFRAEDNNFMITVSQYAQVMGLATESAVPVDVVFVLDTSRSMEGNRVTTMVNAANTAIEALMEANDQNRVAVVAFSGTGGQGTSGGDAASVLSELAHYDGDAATNHIQWVNSSGSATGSGSKNYIQGRGTNAGRRLGTSSGTNIHAGVALGGQLLATATNTTVDGVTRIPFLVLMSDGTPTYAASGTWYAPSQDTQLGTGNDSHSRAGIGFLPVLTAAYYKGLITEHYFGSNASADNRCYVYTMGLGLDGLAEMTMDPANATNNEYADEFADYWSKYEVGNSYNVEISYAYWNSTTYDITAESITATKKYVNGTGLGYTGGYKYNDAYYASSDEEELAQAFDDITQDIIKKAISSPTHVGTHGADFSGYVTFTDPLGAYMELKDMKGIVANGAFLQGSAAAKYLSAYGKAGNANNNPNFDAALKAVLQKRLSMTSSQATDAFVSEFVNTAVSYDNQAYWNSDSSYNNSIVWWGNSFPQGEEDENVQVLSAAADDSIAYIEAQKAANAIPADADYVCRSYFYYGTTQGSEQDYLYFVIRVQRELTAPYKQTVVISAPASLLAVEEVFITEASGANGAKTYTAEVTSAAPARVVYEVGLRSDINPQNVAEKVSADYKGASVDSGYSVNYDAATDTYYFFTNDWNRTVTGEEHHRALAKATFDAAADNAFYTYQQNTTITDEDGNAYKGTAKPSGTWYYVREYYDWSQATYNSSTGVYTGVEKKNAVIRIELAADAGIQQASDGTWYIPKGVYAASTLVVNGDDVRKDENTTHTAEIVAHPHRTGTSSNSHYTVLLGNNGRLAVVSDPAKSVSIGNSNTNDNGKPVMVGDTLTYTIKVVNNEGVTANAVVTDTVPAGTKFISADNSGALQADGKTVRWELTGIPAGENKTVSFKVEVLPSAISGSGNVATIDNVATIQVGNNPAYTTNKVSNPPEGKKVTDTSGNELADGTTVKVGDVLVYRVRAYNDTGAKADITITDSIPAGTTYVPGSADHNGELSNDGKTLTWNIQGVDAGASVVVSFRVEVDASAKAAENATQPENGGINIVNEATIQVGSNDPGVTTNAVTTPVGVGDLSIEKLLVVDPTNTNNYSDKLFTICLTEAEGKLDGTYVLTGSSQNTSVTFRNGNATVTIKGGEKLTIQGLPLGTRINVAEAVDAGWTPSYSDTFVTVSGNTPLVTVTNNYYAQPAHFQLKGTKTFVGSNFPVGNFTFEAVACDANGTVSSGATPITATVTKGEDNAPLDIVFNDVTIASVIAEGNARYFKITEKASAIPGVISDGTEYLLMLWVEDNGKGQLVAHAKLKKANDATTWDQVPEMGGTNSTPLSFTNYYPEETDATISGTKTLVNRYIQDKEFAFELVDETGNVVDTVILGADGNSATAEFSFTRKYTAADMVENGVTKTERIFNYTVREVIGADSSIQYSTQTFPVKVIVTMNANGELVATVDYDTATDGIQSNSNVAFTNTFTPSGTTLSLRGTKNLNVNAGVEGDRTLRAGEFSFSIYKADSTFTNVEEEEIAGGSNAADGTINFGSIGYTLANMDNPDGAEDNGNIDYKYFYYVIKEDVPAANAPTFDPNMVYDGTVYRVAVKVTYNKTTGAMSASVVKVNDTDVTGDAGLSGYNFTNTQNPAYVTFVPSVQKTTSVPSGSADVLHSGLSFSFKVNAATVESNKLVSVGTKVEGTGISKPTVGGSASEITAVDFTKLRINYADWAAANTDGDNQVEYWYAIQESNIDSTVNNGVTYDKTVYLMRVVVVHTDNLLQVDESQTKYYLVNSDNTLTEMSVVFKNTYDAKTHINLSAGKILTGRALKEKEFDFRLQPLEVDNGLYKITSNRAIDGQNTTGAASDMEAAVQFASLNYSTSMVPGDTDDAYEAKFYYLMSEIKLEGAALAGVTYDPNAYIVEITVTKTISATSATMEAKLTGVYTAVFDSNNNGYKVTGEVTTGVSEDGATGVVFRNSYTPTGTSVEIKATKELTGRDLKANEFTFELYRVADNGQEFLAGSVTNDASGNVVFTRRYNASNLSSLGFTEGKYTVTYHMVERTPTQGGVTKVSGEYWIKVTIEQNLDNATYTVIPENIKYYSDAACQNEITDLTAVKFVNKYTTNDAHYTPVAFKAFKGANGVDMPITDGQFTFSVIELNADGSEKNGGAAVAAGVSKTTEVGETLSTVEFGRLTYSHNKTNQDDHNHYYKIVEDQGSEAGVTYDTAKAYYLKVTIKDNHQGVLSVTSATYYPTLNDMKDGTNAIYTQTFGTDSEGNATVTETNSKAEVQFTNHYGPGSITIQPKDLQKKVKVQNHDTTLYDLAGSEFDFDLYEATENDWTLGTLVTSGTNGASVDGVAPINFGSITYTSKQVRLDNTPDSNGKYTKTFYYIAKERDLDAADVVRGLAKDEKLIKLKIVVTDDGYGNLTVAAGGITDNDTTPNNEQQFTNIYTAAPVTVQLTADKTLVNKQPASGEFEFVLLDQDGQEVDSKTNDDNGEIKFKNLEFVHPGEYTYTVKEKGVNTGVAVNNGHYSCDDSVYTVVITVTDDLAGKLHATTTYYKNYDAAAANNTPVAGIDFVNTYTPSSITVDLSTAIGATKTVLDPDGNEMQGKAEGFDFELVDVTGQRIATGGSNAQGQINFNDITFNTAGEYHFRIREMDTGKPGYTMDEQAWRVYVLVRYYDGTGTAPVINGTPVAPGSLYIDAADVQTFPVSELEAHSETAPEFVNIYNPEPLHLTLKATKKLVGRDLLDGEFTFHLVEGNLLRGEAKNQADGTIAFALTYKLPGTYTYELHEHVPAALDKLEGVTYDEKVHTVTVEVKDQNGKLVVDGTTSTWETGVTFENTYKPGPTTATIIAHKVLEGKPLKADEFSFELLDSQKKVIDTVKNDSTGNVVFTVEVPAAGEYHYSIREVKGTDTDHYTYDQNTYKVTVKASQNAAGKLVTEVSYDTADGKMPVFKNTYKPDGTTITLEGTKKLTGRDMAAGEFKFEVRDGVGNLVATGANDAEGKIDFTAVKLPVAGTYKLTVTEVKGSAEGMSYDSSAITVTVKVVNENGVLVATAEYPEAGIVFTNAYEKVEETTVPETTAPEETTVPETTEPEKPKDPTVPDTGDHAKLGLWIGVLAVSVVLLAVTFIVVVIPRKKGNFEK